MQLIATFALVLGVLLAVFGTFVYVWVGMTDPDPETLRISKSAAVAGRWTSAAGIGAHLLHAVALGVSTSPPMLIVLTLAAALAVATHVTKLPPPQTPRPA